MHRLIVPGLLVLLALLSLGYGLYWQIAARTLEEGIQRWATARRAEGYDIRLDELRIGGFPFRLEARVEDPAIVAPPRAGGWRWHGPAIRGHAMPWRPLRIHFEAPGRHDLSWSVGGSRRSLTADAAAATGTVEIAADGRIEMLDLDIGGLAVGDPGAPGDGISVARLTARTILPAPSTAALSSVTPTAEARSHSAEFRIALQQVTLPPSEAPALGRTIERIAADGTLTGRIPPGPPEQALAAWRDDGGTLEFGHLALEWGPLTVAGDGTFALDEAMRPMAAMTATVRGHAETLDALVAQGIVPPREGGIARLLLMALSRSPKDGGPPEIEVALTAQDGYLHAGPVRLFPLPAIRWP